jgi:hypothetical protein
MALDNVLALACGVDGWKVGLSVASTVASSRWFNLMILRRYLEAEEEMRRLLGHPDSSSSVRNEQYRSEIMLLIAQFAQGVNNEAAVRLQALVEHGPNSRGVIASHVYYLLTAVLEDLPAESAPAPELLGLAVAIATAKRASKRKVKACAESTTLGELRNSLANSMNFAVEPRSSQ